MGGMPANHYVEIDEGAAQWSIDADACVDCKSESMRSFRLLVNADNRFAVYVWWLRSDPSPKAGTRQLTARQLVGVAAVSQDRDQSRENAPAVSPGVGFNIHGLGVNEEVRTPDDAISPMARVLLQTLCVHVHQAAFELGQMELVRSRGCGVVVVPVMSLTLLQGSCCTHLRDLAVRLGAASTCPLNAGYFYPTFDRSSPVTPAASITNAPAPMEAWASKNPYNHALWAGRLRMGPSLVCASTRTGLLPIFAPSRACRALEDFLLNPDNNGASKLAAFVQPAPYLQVGPKRLRGFAVYDNVAAPAGHDSRMQMERTFRTSSKEDISALLNHAPGLANLARYVLRQLQGYRGTTADDGCFDLLVGVHFFLVDYTGLTSFKWHTDDEPLNIKSVLGRRCLRSAVIQLGAAGRTAMQVYGFAPFVYEGRGAGAIFHGAALHRSVSLDPPPPSGGIWKVTLFFELPADATSAGWL